MRKSSVRSVRSSWFPRVPRVLSPLAAVLLGAIVLTVARVDPAHAQTDAAGSSEIWLCPICQETEIARPAGAEGLTCPSCDIALGSADLRMGTAYVAIRTKPTQVSWSLEPECGIFRNEGLLVYTKTRVMMWVPWSAIDYYIPRQRILRLTSGRELPTPFSKTKADGNCFQPPIIVATCADSVGDWTKPRELFLTNYEESLSSVYFVARSPTARDSARARFIREVEAGNHPRLPRTLPSAKTVPLPVVPASLGNDSAVVVLQMRVNEHGRKMKVNRLQGSGHPEVDAAALRAAYQTPIIVGGEMGIGVPCSVDLAYRFAGGTVTAEVTPSNPPMWNEWVEPPNP